MGPKTRTRPRVSRADPVQPHRELTWGHTQVAAVGFPAPMGLDWSPWSEPTPSQPVRGLGARSVTDLPVWKPALVPRDPGRAQGESQGGCRSGPGGQGWVHQRPAAHSRESAADGQQDPPGHRRMLPHRLAPHGDTLFLRPHHAPQVPAAPQLLAWGPLSPQGHQGWYPLSTPVPGTVLATSPCTPSRVSPGGATPARPVPSLLGTRRGRRENLGQTPGGLPEDRKAAVGRPRVSL